LSATNRYHPAVNKVNVPAMPDVNPIPLDDEAHVVSGPSVGCDGGGGALGHPLVYLHIEAEGEVVCPYCSRRFVLAEGARPGHGH
jgi:uncharacterized Zn-finger protein